MLTNTPVEIHDLKIVFDYLKKKIVILQSNHMVLYKRISNLEDQSFVTGENISSHPQEGFLQTIEVIIHQQFYAKITLLIDYKFKK